MARVICLAIGGWFCLKAVIIFLILFGVTTEIKLKCCDEADSTINHMSLDQFDHLVLLYIFLCISSNLKMHSKSHPCLSRKASLAP